LTDDTVSVPPAAQSAEGIAIQHSVSRILHLQQRFLRSDMVGRDLNLMRDGYFGASATQPPSTSSSSSSGTSGTSSGSGSSGFAAPMKIKYGGLSAEHATFLAVNDLVEDVVSEARQALKMGSQVESLPEADISNGSLLILVHEFEIHV
jgi:hypothetical protein